MSDRNTLPACRSAGIEILEGDWDEKGNCFVATRWMNEVGSEIEVGRVVQRMLGQ